MARQSSLKEFQQSLAQRLHEATQSQSDSRLGFEAGSRRYLVRLEDASEVLPLPELTPVPLTRSWFLGLANVRGKLVSVVDFSAFMGEPATLHTPQARLVLLAERFGSHGGLLVARVLGLKSMQAFQARDEADPAASAAPWFGAGYVEAGDESAWRELDPGALAASERFLQAGL